MPAVYDKYGVRFQYPENWSLTEEVGEDDALNVTLQSPTSAFWSLTIYPVELASWEVAQEVLTAMRKEYDPVEADETVETLAGTEMVGYDMDFYCLDFVITSQVRSFRLGRRTALLLFQGEDRDFKALALVFQALATSLLTSQPESSVPNE